MIGGVTATGAGRMFAIPYVVAFSICSVPGDSCRTYESIASYSNYEICHRASGDLLFRGATLWRQILPGRKLRFEASCRPQGVLT